jgi:hypothetical protein
MSHFDPGSLYLMDSDRPDAAPYIDVYQMSDTPLRREYLDRGAFLVDTLKSGDVVLLQEIEYSNPGEVSIWVVLYRGGKIGRLMLRERDRRALRYIRPDCHDFSDED